MKENLGLTLLRIGHFGSGLMDRGSREGSKKAPFLNLL